MTTCFLQSCTMSQYRSTVAKRPITLAICLALGATAPLKAHAEGLLVAHDGDGTNYQVVNRDDVVIQLNGGTVGSTYGTVNNYDQQGATNGALALNGGTLNLGGENTKEITVRVNGPFVDGLVADRVSNGTSGGVIHVRTDTLNVDVNADAGTYAYGIRAMTRTTDFAEANRSKIVIDAAQTNIVVRMDGTEGLTNGIGAWSQGQVFINDGNLRVDADNVINTRGESLIEINADANPDHIIELDGNVAFAYADNSATTIDSTVRIELTNAQSYLNGRTLSLNNGVEGEPPAGKDNVSGMEIGLSNGGRWTTDGNSFANILRMNDGILELAGTDAQKVRIDELGGTGGTVRIAAAKTAQGLSSGQLEIRSTAADAAPKLDIAYTGLTADDFANGAEAAEALSELAGNINVGADANVSGTARIREGFINGAVSGGLDFSNPDGAVLNPDTIQTGSMSSTMRNMRDVAAVALVAWRQEDSTLSERLGDLRRTGGDQGLWTRWNRGEFEYSGAFENKYDFLQIGYDRAFDDWHAGLAFSYNDGETTYEAGSGENQSVSALAYGTWLGQAGLYADLVVKIGRLSNEFRNVSEAGVTKGDYDAWGASFSAEAGKAFALTERFTLTPQAQLSYMWVSSEDYDANAGGDRMKVEQEAMQSIVGRLGVKFDAKLAESTIVYAKASVLHDFDGEAETRVSMQGTSGAFTQDIGGTWTDCRLGIDYKLGESAYFWADVTRTFGSDVETPWQWNVGGRYIF